ncbi:Rieske (2Fe-2S) protein [Actinospica acidiphila]|uniref:Cytochrome bc1 complex Rieske iron-sulfur subunit n=1 Tax=Streptomyces tunisiensis TaxID=948699 RepID=A0ABP7Z666_9ACTN|nr:MULTISPECIES: Rieske (2Fe-2S) protein [unclassified Streptomyces]MBQ0972747.1 Rieske (2Fe-2S) protein [Streptomyces sp. RK31]MUT94162.1 Rieske 2Fe-2S domain-containing protein [Streptomyces sp. Z38]NEA80491.1 Rieske (2Fe-2S) protein [Actinospica acidiphila]WPW18104.1 Rieske (2Fe-2S) protein [Streptomyces griseoincarnatus]
MTVSFQPASGPARRTVVAAAGAAGLAVALTACGGSDDGATAAPAESGGAADDAANGGGSGGSAGGTPLASTADIPEGGGKVFADQRVVVVQPSAGEFKAYSATCTHQGCAVKSVSDGLINCPCHNSNFSVTDGSVSSGPATKPLPEVRIAVDGDSITLA